MLLEFGISNYFSIREGVNISFRLDAKCPESISNGLSYTPVICLKGANASGKTTILKGLSFLSGFCTDSFNKDPDEPISLFPFFDSTEPTDFFVDFSMNGIEYKYELQLNDKEVLREVLYKTKQRQVRVFERVGTKIIYAAKSVDAIKTITVRGNASVISTVRKYQIELSDFPDVYKFFKVTFSNVSFSGLRESPRSIQSVSRFLNDNSEVFEFVKNFIKEADTGISDIQIIEISDPDEKEKKYTPIFIHDVDGSSYPVVAMVESSGTKALYRDLTGYFLALKYGGFVVVDELDINLHPFLLSKIVDLFLDEKKNENCAQLIFSSHNTEIMDQLGRYRTYLVNKENNQTFAYRLDEIPGDILRNDRPISPAYKDRKIGGVPNI